MPKPWRQLSEHAWLVPGAVNSLVVERRGSAVVVDSGADRDAGKRLARGLRERGWRLEAIVTSHAHADHIGGHAALLRQHDVPVLAPPLEAELVRAPQLEPMYLFHGAAPLAELTGTWLQAEPSRVDRLIDAGPLRLVGLDLELLAVDGHAQRQLAIVVDDVLYAADAVFGPDLLARYPLPFAHDVGAQREAVERVGARTERVCVPGHGDPDRPDALAAATLAAIDRAARAVDAVLARHPDGVVTGRVLAELADDLALRMDDLPRWHLNHSTVCAYLGTARREGRARVALVEHELRWFPG